MSASQPAADAGTSNSPPPPTTNSPPQQLPTSPTNTAILITPTRVEYMVEGDEIDPDILREPGWKTIRSRIAATTATSATTTPAAEPTKPQQKRRQHRKKPTTPPEDPLPPDDFKVVIRPQGGLDLSTTNAAQLADCIFHQAKITDFAQDQPRRTLPKTLPNIPPFTPETGPDRNTTTFTTPGLTYSQAAQGQTMSVYKRKTVSLNSNSKPPTTLQPRHPIS
ncbi:hypothetical protein ISCGN_032393 [Ixodes scapularis]